MTIRNTEQETPDNSSKWSINLLGKHPIIIKSNYMFNFADRAGSWNDNESKVGFFYNLFVKSMLRDYRRPF
jgi:hypothetical protein